ncbi:NAD-dependent deacylase [Hyphococcus flavus]|uniref:NAD-dependent protein deacylase n=1 Tax=Hyphococcus flavus TaxID=1866326 RepID=A0AAE9ZA87_9PROT|nr:NAD-dependent deacylase [Hyphococcus flavus]WDI30489.1 NAD-dependent deacylase [Hyphococcus flavus]
MMNIVVLTGSGISAESGVATFRDKGGIWSKYDITEVATPHAFAHNPALVHEFYNSRRQALPSVHPNAAHIALAELEAGLKDAGWRFTLVTQNVDDLHERGGSRNILHMHGELLKSKCNGCGDVSECRTDLSVELKCEACGRVGGLRPNVVWFGEVPYFLDETAHALNDADLFVSIGTSGSVYPASGFVNQARTLGVETMELNLECSENARIFNKKIYGPATKVVPQWVSNVLNEL